MTQVTKSIGIRDVGFKIGDNDRGSLLSNTLWKTRKISRKEDCEEQQTSAQTTPESQGQSQSAPRLSARQAGEERRPPRGVLLLDVWESAQMVRRANDARAQGVDR